MIIKNQKEIQPKLDNFINTFKAKNKIFKLDY